MVSTLEQDGRWNFMELVFRTYSIPPEESELLSATVSSARALSPVA